MSNNLLILSAGRRFLLVRYFQQELLRLKVKASVFAADMAPQLSPACQIADACFETPPINHPDYIDRLLELCKENDIRVAIPTFDADLQLLADSRSRFAKHGIELLVSDSELIRQCCDKRLSVELFSRHGILSPVQVSPQKDASFPLIAKPYDGYSSNNLHIIHKPSELLPGLIDDPKMLFFEYLSPDLHEEYTIDMYYDREGFLKCFVPRLRLAIRAGEVSKGRTERLPVLEAIRESFKSIEGARGSIAMQLFVRKSDGHLFGIEINPRFGGGYPLSYEAGANFPAWIVSEYIHGEKIPYFEAWEEQLTMLRYDAHVLVPGAA